MNKKSHDSTDELLRALRASLDVDDSELSEDDSPDDVFGDRASNARHRAADEEQAAFDSYMASLLGEVAEPKPASKRHPKKRVTEAEKATIEAPVLSEEKPQPLEEPTGSELEPAEEFFSMEASLSKHSELETIEVSEAEGDEEEAEQQAIPFDEIETEDPTEDEGTAFSNETDPMLNTAAEAAQEEVLEYLPVEGLAPIAESEDGAELHSDAKDNRVDAELREGDLVLDADDESGAVPVLVELAEKAEMIAVATEGGVEDRNRSTGTITPVSSPLDAARMAKLQATAEIPQPKQSPLDRMAADRKSGRGNVTLVGDASSLGRTGSRERTMSDEDVELLLDLGYENHLTEKLGNERVDTVKNRRDAQEPLKRGQVYGYTGEEYNGHAQDKEIRAMYRKQCRTTAARTTFTVLLTLLIALVDLFPLFRTALLLPESVTKWIPTTGAYGLIGLGLLCLTALLSLKTLLRGTVTLFRGEPSPAAIPIVLLLATLLYDIPHILLPTSAIWLHLPVALSLLFLALGAAIKVRTERAVFAVAGAHSRKITLEEAEAKKKKVVRDGHIVKIIHDDADKTLWRVRHADRIDHYFARMGRATRRGNVVGPLLAVALVLALSIALMTFFVKNDLSVAATAMLLSLELMLPISALIAYVYPMQLATRQLARRGCAIVGDSAVEEYAKKSILLFDDTEMFRSKSSTEITIKGSGDAKKYIRYAKRLFSVLGGTLRGVTTSDLSEETYEDRVEILRVMDEGVEARIDGKVRVLAGTSAFMIQNGIRVPGEGAEVSVRRHVESCILYLAFDGKLRLGYEVDYRISGRFEQMVADLAQSGVATAIETVDPDIHDEFLARSRRPGLSPIRIIKPYRFQKTGETDHADSGVIATRSARDIAHGIIACHRVASNDRCMTRMFRIALVLGAILGGALALLGGMSANIALIAAAFQLLWCLPMLLITRKNMINEQDVERENDNRS